MNIDALLSDPVALHTFTTESFEAAEPVYQALQMDDFEGFCRAWDAQPQFSKMIFCQIMDKPKFQPECRRLTEFLLQYDERQRG
jgi:hypothetical protein